MIRRTEEKVKKIGKKFKKVLAFSRGIPYNNIR